MVLLSLSLSPKTNFDILDFAKENNIKNARKIITGIINVLKRFSDYSEKHKIPIYYSNLIQATINSNLVKAGGKIDFKPLILKDGSTIIINSINLNSKGVYEFKCNVNGVSLKKFINQKHKLYDIMHDIYNGNMSDEKIMTLSLQDFM